MPSLVDLRGVLIVDGVDVRLAQPGEQMFERNVAHQARLGKEVRVVTDKVDPVVGYWAGMDDGFVQLCKSSDQTLILIDRSVIHTVEETGRFLRDMEEAADVNVRMKAKRIRERTQHFARWSDRALTLSKGVREQGDQDGATGSVSGGAQEP